jgi:hypothetical protein
VNDEARRNALADGIERFLSEPDPRPPEGPDREALAAAINDVYGIGGSRNAYQAADAVLALLPTPPAPGEGEGLRAEVERALGAHTFGIQRDEWRTDGHNGCRDVIEVAHIKAALAARDTDQPWSCITDHVTFPGCGTCGPCRQALAAGWAEVRAVLDMHLSDEWTISRIRAALAARDTDQGAPAPGDGEGLRAEHSEGRDCADAEQRIEWLTGVLDNESRWAQELRAEADRLRTALAARDTDQGAGAGVLPLCPVCREPVELWADLHGEAQADCTACDWQTEVAL